MTIPQVSIIMKHIRVYSSIFVHTVYYSHFHTLQNNDILLKGKFMPRLRADI